MTNLISIVIFVLLILAVAKVLAHTFIGILELCSKFAHVIDHTPNRIIILVAFFVPLLLLVGVGYFTH